MDTTGAQRANIGADNLIATVPDWARLARLAIRAVGHAHAEFTIEQVRSRMDAYAAQDAPHPNAWGAVFRQAAKDGEIRRTGAYRESSNPRSRGRRVPVWQWVGA